MLLQASSVKTEKEEKKISDLLALIFFCLILVNLSPIVESITGIAHDTVSMAAKVFLGLGCVINVPVLLRRLRLVMLLLPVMMMVVLLMGKVLFEDTYPYLADTAGTFAVLCLPAMIYLFALRDYEQLRKSFIKMSYVISGVTFFLFLVGFGAIQAYFREETSYSMGLGYAYLIPILFLIQDYITRKKAVSLVFGILLSVFVVAYGSRGPLLGIALFSVSYLYRYLFLKRKLVWIFLISVVALGLIAEYKTILTALITLMQKWGVNSRSLTLISADITLDSGRSIIQQPIIREIQAHPFTIRGINADFVFIGEYSHNIVLEILFEFGVFVGGAILLFLAWCVGKTAFANILETDKGICFIFMCASMTELFVSGSLWTSQLFWVWFALQRNIFGSFAARAKPLPSEP